MVMNAISKPIMTAIEGTAPLVMSALDLSRGKIGLIVVDEVHGFCTPGRGPLAPAAPNPQIERMIEETDLLARRIGPKLVFRDSHTAEQDEKPYPPHCLVGTGDDMLVSRLEWLESDPDTLVMPKECINGVIGGIRPDGSNIVFDWAKSSGVDTLVLVGIYGAAANALYPIAVAHANDFASPEDFVKVSGGLLLLYGVGTIIGPTLGGPIMSAFGPYALFGVTAMAHILITAYAIIRSRLRAPVPASDRDAFTTTGPMATPESLSLSPRAAPLPEGDSSEEQYPRAAI